MAANYEGLVKKAMRNTIKIKMDIGQMTEVDLEETQRKIDFGY